jgi:hypothetical protein
MTSAMPLRRITRVQSSPLSPTLSPLARGEGGGSSREPPSSRGWREREREGRRESHPLTYNITSFAPSTKNNPPLVSAPLISRQNRT